MGGLRILHVSPVPMWDVEQKSGMPSIYWGMKGYLDAGHDVIYLHAGRVDRRYDVDGITIQEFALPTFGASSKRIWIHRASNKILALLFWIKATRRGLEVSRAFRPDVVYGHFHAAPVAWLIGWRRGIPNVTRIFGTFLFPSLRSLVRRWWKFEELITFRTPCTYMIVTNDGTRGDECARFLGVPDQKLKFWINGIDKDMFDPSVDAGGLKGALDVPPCHKLIVAVSRLVSWKRVDRLIAAMPELLRRYPHVTAVIVGDGDARPALETMAVDLGVAANVRFVGAVLHKDVGEFMNAADLFVSLYDFSNVGNPLLEALCCGKCIVSLATGSTDQVVIDGQTGVLLNPAELDRLPETLARLLADDERRGRLGAAARAYAETSLQTWPERMRMEVRCIEELVGRSASVS